MRKALSEAYGAKLPASWLDAIVGQACGRFSPLPRSCGKTVQLSQVWQGERGFGGPPGTRVWVVR